jgi:tetratricopeptide (TPR) repeat protein
MSRVGDLANKLAHEGRAGEIEVALEGMNQATLPDAEREEWWHIYGIAAFQAGRDDVALERFQEAHRLFPSSAFIRFALGQQYIRANEPDKGFALFRETLFPQIPRQHALVEARYAYLHSRYEDGRAFIRPFFEAYKKLRVLDDHFLYVRELPFFGSYWSHLAAFSILSGDWAESDEVTDYVRHNCSDYDFDGLRVERQAYRGGDASLLLPLLNGLLAENSKASAAPTGYLRMRIAVIEARQAQTLGAVQDLIGSVTLDKNDFPWLQDVKTLTVADAAHRFGDPDVEQQNLASFCRRQALLFEPNIALDFWLLEAQERLKAGLVWPPHWNGK